MPTPAPTVGVSARAHDAWSLITADLSADQYLSFALFVAEVAPSVRSFDYERLESLRVTWALRYGEAFPR
jgi:hypothetical protein